MDLTKTDDIKSRIARLDRYCIDKDYAGFCKFDALNSPLLERVAGQSEWLRLVFTQVVNRVPLPLREWLGVPARRNPKGVANFIRAYSELYRATQVEEYRERVILLADWLLRNESHELNAYRGPGKAWGYHFPWQSPGFFAPRHAPNCIVTTFVGEAMLSAFEITGKRRYLDAAFGVRDFLMQSLPVLLDTSSELCIGYVTSGLRWRVININSVAAGFLSRLAVRTLDKDLLARCTRMIEWVCNRRNSDWTWDYTSPKEQSGIGPDNYHTGGILDGIFEYTTLSGDLRFLQTYRNALDSYQKYFFDTDGAPRWRIDRRYPCDIHGSAQGIMTFSRAATLAPRYQETVDKITEWAFKHLWDETHGRFYYQKHPLFTWKIDLMRWSNSWMLRALAESVRMRGIAAGRELPRKSEIEKTMRQESL